MNTDGSPAVSKTELRSRMLTLRAGGGREGGLHTEASSSTAFFVLIIVYLQCILITFIMEASCTNSFSKSTFNTEV